MNEQVPAILRSLVARYGQSLALDPLRCEGLLRDTCTHAGREIFVLVNAVRQQVPADLISPRHSLPAPLIRGFLVKRLQDELAFSEEAAGWAVDTWAGALGVTEGFEGCGPAELSLPLPGPGAKRPAFLPDLSDSTPEERAAWARDLESGKPEARLAAVAGLLHSGDRECIRLLVSTLENSSRQVREAAFDALVALGETAVPHLVDALGDSHEQVVIPAIIALGAIRSRAGVDPLILVLDGGGEPARYAAWALGECHDDRATTPLAKRISSSDTILQLAAEEALRKLASPE
jgi:hypothetical protein